MNPWEISIIALAIILAAAIIIGAVAYRYLRIWLSFHERALMEAGLVADTGLPIFNIAMPDPPEPVPQGDGDGDGDTPPYDPATDLLLTGEGGAWTKAARERRNWR